MSRRLLDSGGLNVGIENIGGSLSDHYDPRDKVMRLSEPVGNSRSVAAIAVAAHETGHAFQDAKHDASFRLRSSLVPAVGFASKCGSSRSSSAPSPPRPADLRRHRTVRLRGALQPRHAARRVRRSKRALSMLTAQGIITPTEAPVARRVLTAAAFTYIVAALISIMQIVYLLGMARR